LIVKKDSFVPMEMVDSYVKGKLDPDELEIFELALMSQSDLQDEVEIAAALHAQMKLASGRLKAVERQPLTGLRYPLFGACAAGLLAVSLLGNLVQFSSKRNVVLPAHPRIEATNVSWLETSRNANDTTSVRLVDGTALLRIDVGPTPQTSYQVSISKPDEPVPNQHWLTLRPNPQKALDVLLSDFEPGDYQVNVKELDPDSQVIREFTYPVSILRD